MGTKPVQLIAADPGYAAHDYYLVNLITSSPLVVIRRRIFYEVNAARHFTSVFN